MADIKTKYPLSYTDDPDSGSLDFVKGPFNVSGMVQWLRSTARDDGSSTSGTKSLM
jgi:hypothetical protein